MNQFKSMPFVRILFGLFVGIIVSYYSNIRIHPAALMGILSITVLGLWRSWRLLIASGSMILMAFVGFYLIDGLESSVRVDDVQAVDAFRGEVITPPIVKPSGTQVVIEIRSIRRDGNWKIAKSKVLVYREDYGGEIGSKRWLKQFIGKTENDSLKYGDDIVAISGATISVRSMTTAINNLLASIKILRQNNQL